MLNRKLLALVLPAVAVSALVGSGFSAWYFSENNIKKEEQNVNVIIADMVDNAVGTFTLNETNATTLTLDQGGYQYATDPKKGISFDAASVGAKFTFKDGAYDNLTSAGMKVVVTRTITFTANLLEYVKVTGLSNYTPDSTVHTITQDVTSNTGLTDTISLMSGDVCTFLEYIEGKKPGNSTDYGTMKSNLAKASITFEWSAEVVEVGA